MEGGRHPLQRQEEMPRLLAVVRHHRGGRFRRLHLHPQGGIPHPHHRREVLHPLMVAVFSLQAPRHPLVLARKQRVERPRKAFVLADNEKTHSYYYWIIVGWVGVMVLGRAYPNCEFSDSAFKISWI